MSQTVLEAPVQVDGIITDMTDPSGSIECQCEGNMGYFFPANAEGLIVWENHPSDKVAPWVPAHEMHALCYTCGNLFSHAALESSESPNVAAVKVVDFSEPKHLENLEAFQSLIS